MKYNKLFMFILIYLFSCERKENRGSKLGIFYSKDCKLKITAENMYLKSILVFESNEKNMRPGGDKFIISDRKEISLCSYFERNFVVKKTDTTIFTIYVGQEGSTNSKKCILKLEPKIFAIDTAIALLQVYE